MDVQELIAQCRKAKAVALPLASLTETRKNKILFDLQNALLVRKEELLAANEKDLGRAEEFHLTAAMRERLALSVPKIEAMAEGVAQLAALPDPCGKTLSRKLLSNGLEILRVSVPFGVVAMIYESRPNVTVDAAALCLKSGNACILRGGKEAHFTNEALTVLMHDVLSENGLSPDTVTSILDSNRQLVTALLTQRELIDLAIPRGGAGLIRSVLETATVPVIETGSGVCHTYVDKAADFAKAVPIIVNAKTQRPSVCNAMETLLVHEKIAENFLPLVFPALREKGVEIRGDARVRAVDAAVLPADESDWATEYGDLILSVKIVGSLEEAVSHIARYGTHHSECILSEDKEAIRRFMDSVDAACVYANASTRFTDGFEFGLGAEIGISTQKLHVRGPMGLEALVTTKYKIFGNGQIRG